MRSAFFVSAVLMMAGGLVAASAGVGQAAGAASSRFRISGGFDYSTGKYGASQSTRILSLPYSARFERGPWQFKLSLPFIRIEGPGRVVGGADGGIVIGPGARTTTTRSGVGDLLVSVGRRFAPPAKWLPYVTLTGKVKLPTASRIKRLGTGRADYSIQADLFTALGKFTPFATLGYRNTGNLPNLPLKDTIFASGGFGYRLSKQWRGGAFVSFRQASTARSSKRLAVIPYVTWKFTRKWAINLYGVAGLAAGSPDAGVGMQLSRTQ